MRPFIGSFSCLLFVACVGSAFAQEAPPPAALGPYPVGVTSMLLEDHTRDGGTRSLMTEIWYPATEDSRGLPKNRLLDFFGNPKTPAFPMLLKMAFGADIVAADKIFQNEAVRDARARKGRFPLLLFSHGNGGMRMQNAFLCEHLASHGYIVAAPDHTHNSVVTVIDGEMVVFDDSDGGRQRSAKARPLDLSFLIDSLERMNKGGDSRFQGKIDLERIGVTGHSFGGFTSTWIAVRDARVDAIAPLAGVASDAAPPKIPALVIFATEDDTLGLERVEAIRKYYEACEGPRYSVEFKNGGHYTFTEMFQLNPAFGDGVGSGKRLANDEALDYLPMEKSFLYTKGYCTAFFGRYLKGISPYADYLTSNLDAQELLVQGRPE
jgi:dienelactone hydrolase